METSLKDLHKKYWNSNTDDHSFDFCKYEPTVQFTERDVEIELQMYEFYKTLLNDVEQESD